MCLLLPYFLALLFKFNTLIRILQGNIPPNKLGFLLASMYLFEQFFVGKATKDMIAAQITNHLIS